jgi:hypothetical protein
LPIETRLPGIFDAARDVISEYPSLSELPRFLIDRGDVGTINEFWRRYVDAVSSGKP